MPGNAGLTAELLHPEVITEHHHGFGAAGLVGWSECAADERLDAQDGEEIVGDHAHRRSGRPLVAENGERHRVIFHDVPKIPQLLFVVPYLLHGEGDVSALQLLILPQHHEASIAVVGQLLHDDIVECREDCRVDANGHCERADDDEGRPRPLHKAPAGISDIAE